MTAADDIKLLIGKLYTNMQALEFAIRGALYEKESPPHNPLQPGVSINTFKTGDTVPENAMTDYSTLGQLIDRFNTEIAKGNNTLKVSNDVVTIRDALAHGRASANSIDENFSLIKFDRPKNSMVNVVFAQKLTSDWLKEKVRFVFDEAMKVIKAGGLDT